MLLHNRIDLRPSFAFAPRWCSSFKYNRSRPKKFYCIRHVFATRWRSSFVSSRPRNFIASHSRNRVVSCYRNFLRVIDTYCCCDFKLSREYKSFVDDQFVSANSTCIKLLNSLSREFRPRVSNCIIRASSLMDPWTTSTY